MDSFSKYIPILRKMIPHLIGMPLETVPVDWTEEELATIKKLLDNSEGCDTL